MAELRRAMPHHDLVGHAEIVERVAFELRRIERRDARHVGLQQMKLHVDQRAGEELDRLEALVERGGMLDLRHEFPWNRPAGRVMQRKAIEHLRRGEPVLQHLRWEFDVVAGHVRTGDGGIADVGTEAVQRVAKLVEQRGGIVPADQCRLARQRLCKVTVVGNDRGDGVVEVFLRLVGTHPGTRLLSLSGERVEVPQPHHRAGRVANLPDPHVGMVDGHRLRIGGLELETKELAGREEHRLAEVVELQVGGDLALVEVVLRPADLLGVEAVVPRGDSDPCPLCIGDGLHVSHLLADSCHGGLPDRLHQLHGTFGRLGHRVFQPPVGVGWVAEQVAAAGPQREDRGDRGVIVGRAAARAPIDEHPPDPLPRVAALGIGQEGLDARPRVGDGPVALLTTRLRSLGGGPA